MKPQIVKRRHRFTGEMESGWIIRRDANPLNDWCAGTFELAVRVAVAMATGQPIPTR